MVELKKMREMALEILKGAEFDNITADLEDEDLRDFKIFLAGYLDGYYSEKRKQRFV